MTVSTGRMLVLEWPSVYIGRFGIFRVPMLHPTLNILVPGKIQKRLIDILGWGVNIPIISHRKVLRAK